MPKPDKRPAPDTQSRENAIESRTVEGFPDALGCSVAGILAEPVSTAQQQGDTQEQETRETTPTTADNRPQPPTTAGTQETGDVPATEPVSTDTQPQEGETYIEGLEQDLRTAISRREAEREMGDVPATAAAEPTALDDASRAKKLAASVMNRLKASKQWFGLVDLVRDQMMREAKATIPDLVQRQLWVYAELDRMYPPVQEKPPETDMGFVGIKGLKCGDSDMISVSPSSAGSDSGSIQGLEDMPKSWPAAPANASLPSEIAWVQANRLRVVEERPGKATVVRLDLALSPAPSWAALGWLETSIRSYAKFVDVAAKVSGGADDEGAVLRRERKAVDEVKALLREMEEAEGTCPSCGRAFAGN